jgi:hypothetical protein
MMNYAVYYRKPNCWQDTVTIDSVHKEETHRFLGFVDGKSLEDVFEKMQGEVWSPEGEAREMILALGLTHTSMMMGDVAVDSHGTFWLCDFVGWKALEK